MNLQTLKEEMRKTSPTRNISKVKTVKRYSLKPIAKRRFYR